MSSHILQLGQETVSENILYRLENGSTVQFFLGYQLKKTIGRIRFFCNYPLNHDNNFDRAHYHELEWHQQGSREKYCQLTLKLPGAFQFYYQIDDGKLTSNNEKRIGFLIVDPTIYIAGKRLPLEAICMQTVLTKCLGPLSEWQQRLQVAKECGYNALHFTPLQQLGASGSCYSLYDQLTPNSSLNSDGKADINFDDIHEFFKKIEVEWGMMVITDVVWNHTSYNTPWLKDHPEATYNLVNSPHLRPAFLIDRALYRLTVDVLSGRWQFWGLTDSVKSDRDLDIIATILRQYVLPEINLFEFFAVDVDKIVLEFQKECKNIECPDIYCDTVVKELKVAQDPEYKRFGCVVDMQEILRSFNVKRIDVRDEDERVSCNCEWLRIALQDINKRARDKANGIIDNVVQSVYNTARYERIDENGPKHDSVTDECPIVTRYFHCPYNVGNLNEDEDVMNNPELACHISALNGWVFNDDPLKNFAEPESEVYMRRFLMCWGDSCKLRYGKKPEDSPFLWDYMRRYSELMAKLCHGLRIDNCHSTPIHVAQYLLDAARKIRPQLFIVAELFTNSEDIDNLFVNNLGITCLIREMSHAPNSHEEGRLVYKYGGEPIGSFPKSIGTQLRWCTTPAILTVVTHDNQCLLKVRSIWDCLPTVALTSMANCCFGSTRGFDELVPIQISVVSEDRLYTTWTENEIQPTDSHGLVGKSQGIIEAVYGLNKLHSTMGYGHFNEVYVDQMDQDTVAVTRFCPEINQSIVLIARSCFNEPKITDIPTSYNPAQGTEFMKPLLLEGNIIEVILEARLLVRQNPMEYVNLQKFITGWWQSHSLDIRENIKYQNSRMISVQKQDLTKNEITFVSFPPGSIIALRVQMESSSSIAITTINECLTELKNRNQDTQLDTLNLFSIIEKLTLTEINYILYRCNSEEKDDDPRTGAYVIPEFGELVYCGLQGFISVLDKIRRNNDLGHPFCKNLREGPWMMDYISNRLKAKQSTWNLGHWLHVIFKNLKMVPIALRPKFFDDILKTVNELLLEACWNKMSSFVRNGTNFVHALALGSVQLIGHCKSAILPSVIENNSSPDKQISFRSQVPSMAAGLPHFSTGSMRCWGRDTFIAMRGLMLVTGRFEEARDIIVAFGGCLRHGLIPNLLDKGINARYNCRDATWWWLQCIQDYCTFVASGHKILEHPVARMYVRDDDGPKLKGETVQPLYEVIQEALQRHIDGITFREHGAGPMLDRAMKDKGFDVSVGVNRTTGFVYGGSEHNCGTWMDKMGESVAAGNCGIPATPRNGSAIEIIGLCKSTLRWLTRISKNGKYPYKGVKDPLQSKKSIFTFEEWDTLLLETFEKHFWIDEESKLTDSPLIHRRGIYKDCLGATHQYTDFQLRPNQCVAMVVAPELFKSDRVWKALQNVKNILCGPLGMKTLDPKDWNYNGHYVNWLESHDYKSSKGFNYHQGPEWIWCTGYFLRAMLIFADTAGCLEETKEFVKSCLADLEKATNESDWKGLPELTNKDGEYCADSCPVQAWSAACTLDVLYDLEHVQ